MNIPKALKDLVMAQSNYDSTAFANCFSPTAEVLDEGKTYTGRAEIQHWIAEANKNFKTVMKPLAFTETGSKGILTAEVSGSFPGSPAVLNYNFELKDDLIESLKITS